MLDLKLKIAEDKIPKYSWYALALLTIIYIGNFVDRVLIYLLFSPIKKEMHFTDLQLALLGSTSFVIFYTLLGIPFGRLADKYSRKKIIAFGLAVWSVFSGLTGFANSFWTIFFCRMMVGIGEASLGPAALSLLSDYFPSRMRATVQAIFTSAIAIGTGVAFFFGGWINDAFSWRHAFYFLGFPGLAFAVLILFLIEPQRGIRDSAPKYQSTDWKLLIRNAPLKYILLGYAFFAVAANSVSMWLPTFFVRTQGISVAQVGVIIGFGTMIGGLPGTVMAGFFADKLRVKRTGGRLLFTSFLALLCIPFWIILLIVNSLIMQIICVAILLGLALSWLGPAAADVNDIAGPHLRGLAIGLYYFVVNVIGYGFGPPLIGKINDFLSVAANPEMMRYALLVSPVACLVAALILFRGSKILEKQK
jgi:MFS family permease